MIRRKSPILFYQFIRYLHVINLAISDRNGLFPFYKYANIEDSFYRVSNPLLRQYLKYYYKFKLNIRKGILNRELYDAQGSTLIDFGNLKDGDKVSIKKSVLVPCMSLANITDYILKLSNLDDDQIHLIYKIDIEGAEFDVLEHFLKNPSPLVKSIKSSFYIEWHERLFDVPQMYSKKRDY